MKKARLTTGKGLPTGCTLATWVPECWGAAGVLGCLLGFAVASGCSGNIDTGPDDAGAGASGQGGSSGSAGSSGSGGAGRGGWSGSAGSAGSASGGTSGTGGIGNTACMPLPDEALCFQCARRNCCTELLACGGDSACFRAGGPEMPCMMRCVQSAVAEGGVADEDTFRQCAGACAAGGTIATTTNELFTCLITGERRDGAIGADCVAECFEPADAG
jgi:hypothetical protein